MNQTNSVLGVLVGAAVGAGLGVLFAPEKGSVTRKKLENNVNAAKGSLLEEAEKLKANVSTGAENIRNSVANSITTKKATIDTQLDAIITDGSYKADDLITSLEHRLKTLRAKNRKLQTAK